MDKKKYEASSIEILRFTDDDIITQSGGDNLGVWHDTWNDIFDNSEE